MAKLAPTLMDEVYRAACRPQTNPGWKSNIAVRHALERARRFTVDEPMAGFMAELANESFHKAGIVSPLALRIADSIRVQSRLPYESIWIEYPLRAYQKRASEIRAVDQVPEEEIPFREGWLIQQHPGIETAYIMHMWTQSDREYGDGFRLWTFPFAFGWCADDSVLPWRGLEWFNGDTASAIIVGIERYERDNVNLVQSPLITDAKFDDARMNNHYANLLKEWAGVIRRVWSLLASINDIPKIVGEVRQSKGFLGGGRMRKYLDHSTITLAIPGKKDTRVLARHLIAAAHRRRHPVRAHWRDHWRHPPATQCQHMWEVMDEQADRIKCSLCHGQQTFIHKHERGDATLGWVSHSYAVTHEVQAPEG